MQRKFAKLLTANDTGETGAHQAGIHIPKSQRELIEFLPTLDPARRNPDAWVVFVDSDGLEWKFRYIYYNNALHDRTGTRNEYRLTHMTGFFRAAGAKSGDTLVIHGDPHEGRYRITIDSHASDRLEDRSEPDAPRIKLRGWRRVH